MKIRNSIIALKDEITAYRRTLHENPQTAYEEEFASNLIAEKLREWGIPFEQGIAKTGIVATIEGEQNTSGKTIGLRADIDALDILEEPNKDWHSKIPGKMHGCGHDGHTAILLGAAKYLSENKNFNGCVLLIFQPAEEGAGGAIRMIDEGLFRKFPCDEVYAVHNWPDMPRGTMATRSGPIMASADRFTIQIQGKGGHAAMPSETIDPIIIGTQIITSLQTLISRNSKAVDPAVLSITNFHAGTGAFNVIPETAELSGTIRCFDPKQREFLIERTKTVALSTAELLGGTATCEFGLGYDPTINTPEATRFCLDIARGIAGDENVNDNCDLSMGAEDFGAMLQEKPGCYILIGQGEPGDPDSNHNQGLHTPQYDFNDEIIPIGIEYWIKLVEKALPL